MIRRQIPSQELLNRLLNYTPETGELTWKERRASDFSSGRHSAARTAAKWNSRYAGTRAFSATTNYGYLCGRISKTNYLAHRIIWKMVYGRDPSNIDHINGSRTDNRLINLRDVSAIENMRNQKLPRTNSTGVLGVVRNRDKGFRAQIHMNGKGIHLGCFATIEEAAAARRNASAKFGFHETHGRVP